MFNLVFLLQKWLLSKNFRQYVNECREEENRKKASVLILNIFNSILAFSDMFAVAWFSFSTFTFSLYSTYNINCTFFVWLKHKTPRNCCIVSKWIEHGFLDPSSEAGGREASNIALTYWPLISCVLLLFHQLLETERYDWFGARETISTDGAGNDGATQSRGTLVSAGETGAPVWRKLTAAPLVWSTCILKYSLTLVT